MSVLRGGKTAKVYLKRSNYSAEERKRGLLLPEPGGNSGVSLACQAEEGPIVINVTQNANFFKKKSVTFCINFTPGRIFLHNHRSCGHMFLPLWSLSFSPSRHMWLLGKLGFPLCRKVANFWIVIFWCGQGLRAESTVQENTLNNFKNVNKWV